MVENIARQPLDANLSDLAQMVYLILLEYDEDKLQRMLKQLKLQKFTARLMQILQEIYFLEEGYMPIPPIDDKRTNNIRKSLQQSDTL